MNTGRWEAIRELFHRVRALDAEDRATALRAECEDPEIRQVVQDMADSDARADLEVDGFLLASPAERHALPQQVGPYRVRELLGRGGMSDVYLAEAIGADGDPVAVKVLRTTRGGTETRERFAREREILERLSHPNICRLLDAGATDQGNPFLVMDHVDGWPLGEYGDEHRLDGPERVRLWSTVCGAVQFAHDCGVLHRDLKPSNVLVTEEGDPVLLDFGISKLLDPVTAKEVSGFVTPAGVRLLTPAYAAPEQVRGASPTTRTDVHALGLILYELLTGRRAFDPQGRHWQDWERSVMEDMPLPPSVGSSSPYDDDSLDWAVLDAVVLRALEKDPTLRHPSARALAAAAMEALSGE